MKAKESQALRDVWEWKDRAHKEIEHLSTDLKKRLQDSLQTVRQLGLPMTSGKVPPSLPKIAN